MDKKQVWVKDCNSRVYEKGSHSPIYRGYFVKRYVIGETRISWILGYSPDSNIKRGIRHRKKQERKTIWWSEKEIDEACWINEHSYKLAEKITRSDNFLKLKEVEKIMEEKWNIKFVG